MLANIPWDNYLWATLIACGLAAVYFKACNRLYLAKRRRIILEMADYPCPGCKVSIGYEAVERGKNCTPWEELWSDGVHHTIHCHPTYQQVECVRCGLGFVIRLNQEGESFGPRLSSKEILNK